MFVDRNSLSVIVLIVVWNSSGRENRFEWKQKEKEKKTEKEKNQVRRNRRLVSATP